MIAIRHATLGLSLTTLVFALAACSDAGSPNGEVRTVSVTGTGDAQAAPDQAQLSAGVESFADTVAAASQNNESAVRRIMKALSSQGIEGKDIGTSNYSIWAEQNYNEPDRRITGYHVSNIVTVTIKDITKIGEVLAAVTNAGANSVQGIAFSVSDTDALENQARERAMADARRRAESLTSLAGVGLGEVVSLSTSSGPDYRPVMAKREMMEMSVDAPSPSITPGQQSISVQIQVTYAIR